MEGVAVLCNLISQINLDSLMRFIVSVLANYGVLRIIKMGNKIKIADYTSLVSVICVRFNLFWLKQRVNLVLFRDSKRCNVCFRFVFITFSLFNLFAVLTCFLFLTAYWKLVYKTNGHVLLSRSCYVLQFSQFNVCYRFVYNKFVNYCKFNRFVTNLLKSAFGKPRLLNLILLTIKRYCLPISNKKCFYSLDSASYTELSFYCEMFYFDFGIVDGLNKLNTIIKVLIMKNFCLVSRHSLLLFNRFVLLNMCLNDFVVFFSNVYKFSDMVQQLKVVRVLTHGNIGMCYDYRLEGGQFLNLFSFNAFIYSSCYVNRALVIGVNGERDMYLYGSHVMCYF